MKRSVSKETKAAAVLAPIVLVVGYFTQANETGLIFLMLGGMLVYAMLYALVDSPPPWLLRSALGRWLRR